MALTQEQQVQLCCQVVVIVIVVVITTEQRQQEQQQDDSWKTKKSIVSRVCVHCIWQAFPQQSRRMRIESSIFNQ